MNIILLFSIDMREEEEKLKEIFNLVFLKKFHKYGNKSINKMDAPSSTFDFSKMSTPDYYRT